eukprot:2975262-Amphidinium_carterae.1
MIHLVECQLWLAGLENAMNPQLLGQPMQKYLSPYCLLAAKGASVAIPFSTCTYVWAGKPSQHEALHKLRACRTYYAWAPLLTHRYQVLGQQFAVGPTCLINDTGYEQDLAPLTSSRIPS